MAAALSHHRLLAVVSDGVRIDCAAPTTNSVRELLVQMNVMLDVQRHVVISHHGYEVDLETPVADLPDGSLLTVVDTWTPKSRAGEAARHQGTGAGGPSMLWWLLGTAAVVLAGGAWFAVQAGQLGPITAQRVLLACGLALAAVVSAGSWILRAKGASSVSATVLLAPVILAFTSGLVATPALDSAPHLAVVLGLLSSAIVTTVLAVIAREKELRSVAGTGTVVLLILAGVWAITLLLDWTMTAAAAISLGMVAPGIAFIPATVMNFPEGYSISYVHFMSNRWTVRGSIPEDPGTITAGVVQPYLAASTARMTVGTGLLSLIAVVTSPAVVAVTRDGSLVNSIGAWTVLTATALALLLMPRRATSRMTRWTPRVAAAIILLQLTIALGVSADGFVRMAVAGGLLLAGLLGVLIMFLVARGTRSLVWSRLADVVENVFVILALPAAMLAAGTIDFARTMVSG